MSISYDQKQRVLQLIKEKKNSAPATKQDAISQINEWKAKQSLVVSENKQGVTGIEGVRQGFGKGILQTIKGAGQLGEQVGSALLPDIATPKSVFSEEALSENKEQGGNIGQLLSEENLKARGTAEKFGKGAEQIAEFIVPATKISKASQGASFLRKALGQGGIDALVQTVQSGEVGRDTAVAGGVGASLPYVGKYAVKPLTNLVTKYGGNVLQSIAGFVSGKGSDAVERVFKNPEEALKGMQGDEVQVLTELGKKARQGVSNIKKQASKEYGDLIQKGNLADVKLNLDKLENESKQLVSELLEIPIDKKGQLVFENTPLVEAEERQLNKIINKISGWTDSSPEGINKLATSIKKFRKSGQDAEFYNLIVDDLRRNVRNFVGKEVPEIAEANLNFSQAMDMVEDLDNILKTKGAVDSKEGVRKTAEAIQLLFGSRKELKREAVDAIRDVTGTDIVSQEAGRQFQDLAPRSTASIGDSVSQAISSLIPPQLIGQVTARLGITAKRLNDVLSGLDTNTRGAVAGTLINLLEEDSTE